MHHDQAFGGRDLGDVVHGDRLGRALCGVALHSYAHGHGRMDPGEL